MKQGIRLQLAARRATREDELRQRGSRIPCFDSPMRGLARQQRHINYSAHREKRPYVFGA